MVQRVIEDEIAGLSYANKQAALISVVGRGEKQENEYERDAVISGNKGGKLAVW